MFIIYFNLDLFCYFSYHGLLAQSSSLDFDNYFENFQTHQNIRASNRSNYNVIPQVNLYIL